METNKPVEEQTTNQQDTAENDAVRLLLELLDQQKAPSQNFMEVLQYVAGMQMQLNVMVNELQSVKEQLGKMQESQPEKKKHPLLEKLFHLQEKVTKLATHLSEIKDQLVDTAVQAVSGFKEKGREDMNKVLQKGLSGVKEALLGHRERLLGTLTSYEQTANQIDSIGAELKQIGNSAANVGRLLSGTGTKEVSGEEPGIAVTRAINAPVKKHITKLKKQMDGIDRTIEKIDGISSSLSAGKNIEKDAEKGEEKGTRVSVKEKLSQMRAKSQQQKAPEKPTAKSKEECL